MLTALVLACALAGALFATLTARREGAWGRWPARRTMQGALVGAVGGLLLIPVLGLLAAVVFFILALAVVAALAVGIFLVSRRLPHRSWHG